MSKQKINFPNSNHSQYWETIVDYIDDAVSKILSLTSKECDVAFESDRPIYDEMTGHIYNYLEDKLTKSFPSFVAGETLEDFVPLKDLIYNIMFEDLMDDDVREFLKPEADYSIKDEFFKLHFKDLKRDSKNDVDDDIHYTTKIVIPKEHTISGREYTMMFFVIYNTCWRNWVAYYISYEEHD